MLAGVSECSRSAPRLLTAMKITFSLLMLTLAVVRSEPPVDYSTTQQDAFAPPPVNGPSSSYGPPSASYGPPSMYRGRTRGHTQAVLRRPSTSYGAPPSGVGFTAPSVNIGGRGGGYSGHGSRGGYSGGYRRPSSSYGAPSGGYDYDDGSSGPASYQFSYHVQDASSGNDFGHQENREGHVATGMYMVLLPDGRRQIVEYTADENGYHPIVRYEGTAISAPSGGGGYRY